jgi:hypothetical protein
LSSTKKYPLEDYLTEIFAHVLRSRKDIFFQLLKEFDISNLNELGHYNVKTQQAFSKSNDQYSDSRLDIFIKLIDQKEIIIFESKIGSGEGYQQLKKYAKQLENFVDCENRVLIYITRDYDPKDYAEITNNNELKFKQIRWYQMYQFLKKYKKNDSLIKEVVKFMEENNLALNNQFSNIDILSMSNFPRALKMMNETMEGDVEDKFKKLYASISKGSSSFAQIKNNNRYIYFYYPSNCKIWCGYGYWFTSQNLTDYPKVLVFIELTPKSNQHDKFITIGNKIVNISRNKWQPGDLVTGEKWPRILQLKSLQEFMSGHDHITAIKDFFIGALDDVKKIKEEHPQLPWPE